MTYQDDPSMHDVPREEIKIMREESLGPVANPDGSPTELTKQMLKGTGRDPDEFAATSQYGTTYADLSLEDQPFVDVEVDEQSVLRSRRGAALDEYMLNMKAIQFDVNRIMSGDHDGEAFVKLTLYSIKLCLSDAINAFNEAYNLREAIVEALRKAHDEGKD